MAEVVQTLIDTVLRRVRDTQAAATSRSLVLSLLSEVQRIVNAHTGDVISSASLTTVAFKQIYKLSDDVPNAVKVRGVRDGSRDLELSRWEELARGDVQWFRRVGGQFEIFSTIGRDILVVHPARDAASSVTVDYVKLTTALTLETDTTEIDDDNIPLLLDIIESLLLLRVRNLVEARLGLQRISLRLGGVPVG